MPIKIQIAKYVAPVKREKILISPKEKFNRLSKRLMSKGKDFRLRKFHFTVIESGKMITLFDGEGIEIARSDNSIEGYRILRQTALRLFLDSENQNGGFNWTTTANIEYQTPEELVAVGLLVQKSVEYKPFAVCADCKFQFQDSEEMKNHKCTNSWMVLEFVKMRRVYV